MNDRRPVRVAVIGAGMAGILTAIKLHERGIDFTVYEKADRLGGTWRENTYPGLSCDVPSHLYTYSFAPQPRVEPPVLARAPRSRPTSSASPPSTASTARIRFGDEVDELRVRATAAGTCARRPATPTRSTS